MSAPELITWTIIYYQELDELYEFFQCLAENAEHAEEQFQDAYPNHVCLWTSTIPDPDEALNEYLEELQNGDY